MLLWTRNVYLDHNATTPVAPEVREAMQDALRNVFGNPSSLHTHGRTAKGLVERARESVAALLECPPERVVFTSGGTEGNNAVIKGVYGTWGRTSPTCRRGRTGSCASTTSSPPSAPIRS